VLALDPLDGLVSGVLDERARHGQIRVGRKVRLTRLERAQTDITGPQRYTNIRDATSRSSGGCRAG
jgi:hypothetical protein